MNAPTTITLRDRTALVTGASRGIGRSIARTLADAGATVFVGYLARRSKADETVSMIEASGGAAHPLQLDVSQRESVRDAVARVSELCGPVDVLVNNAAITRDGWFALMGEKDWSDVLAVNLDGIYHCSRAVLAPMLRRERGTIVNIGSVVGLNASPGQANYAASKAALVGLTRTMAAELGPRGIRVNAVLPGLMDTGMAKRVDASKLEGRLSTIPLGRSGRGGEVGAAVLFLASEMATYITGHCLVVDGGLSL